MPSPNLITRFSISLVLVLTVCYSVVNIVKTSYQKHESNYTLQTTAYGKNSAEDTDRQLRCLAQNVYWEAGTETFEGKVAVAQVTLNRTRSNNFPHDICNVVYQKSVLADKVICQFSWYCDRNVKFRPVHPPLYRESEIVARKVLLEGFKLDSVNEALYYHADYVNPAWKKAKVAKIGRHIFYK